MAGTDRLSHLKVRAFIKQSRAGKATTKKLADGGWLFLTLTPAGTPVWRVKYRHYGKERVYAAVVYPEVSLEAASGERDWVRVQLKSGRDAARADVFDYIERFCNPLRRHSTLGNRSPVAYEHQAAVA